MKRSRRIPITLSALTLTIMPALTATFATASQPQHHVTADPPGGGSRCCGGG